MELRHLRAFVTVAEELHFGNAAARLQLSPSPVSRTVLELERELRVKLFVRGHHQVRLTEAGSELLSPARQLLESWDSFTAHGRELGRAADAPRIRIGNPTLAPPIAVDRVTSVLNQLQPGTMVDVEVGPTAELIAALRGHDLDLTIALLPQQDPDLKVLPLGHYQLSLVVPDNDELAARGVATKADLAGRRILMARTGHASATDPFAAWLTQAGATIAWQPDADMMRVAQLVHHGRGIAFSGATGSVAHLFAAQPGLSLVPMHDEVPRMELGLVWRASDDDHANIRPVVERLTGLTYEHGLEF